MRKINRSTPGYGDDLGPADVGLPEKTQAPPKGEGPGHKDEDAEEPEKPTQGEGPDTEQEHDDDSQN